MSLPTEASERAMPYLTRRTVESLQAIDKDVVVWDSDLRGFGLRIRVGSGLRYCVVKYRIGSRQRWETLGQHGALTAEQARRLASKILGQVREGSTRRPCVAMGRASWSWPSATCEITRS